MFDDFRSTALLPAVEEEVARVIGRGRAILLSNRIFHLRPYRHGSDKVHGIISVPRRMHDGFVELVGNREDAEKLSSTFGGEQLYFSGCRSVFRQAQHHAIRFLRRNGVSSTVLARLSQLNERQIRRICSGEPVKSRQSVESLAPEMRSLHALSAVILKQPYTRKCRA